MSRVFVTNLHDISFTGNDLGTHSRLDELVNLQSQNNTALLQLINLMDNKMEILENELINIKNSNQSLLNSLNSVISSASPPGLVIRRIVETTDISAMTPIRVNAPDSTGLLIKTNGPMEVSGSVSANLSAFDPETSESVQITGTKMEYAVRGGIPKVHFGIDNIHCGNAGVLYNAGVTSGGWGPRTSEFRYNLIDIGIMGGAQSGDPKHYGFVVPSNMQFGPRFNGTGFAWNFLHPVHRMQTGQSLVCHPLVEDGLLRQEGYADIEEELEKLTTEEALQEMESMISNNI